MNSETKLFGGIMAATLVLIVGVAVLLGNKSAPKPVDQATLVNQTSEILGAYDAKVTIVEFSDFECPACKSAEPTVEQVLDKYKGKIRFVYRHFPLSQHQYGFIAAQAAEAAGLQNKFWEMHKLLFEKSPQLSQDDLFKYAMTLNIDVAKFAADYNSETVKNKIQQDLADGNKTGLTVTPTFFINGTKIDGALSLAEFFKEIDARL